MHKICHMTSAHPPGDTRIFQKECVSLAKAGYEVYLVERGESYDQHGVHVVGIGQPSGGRLNRMTRFARKVYEVALALDADVYHFHDPELLPYGLKLKKKGKKVIFDSHEYYQMQLQEKPYLPNWCMRIIAAIYAQYERYVLKRLDGLVFPSTINGVNPFEGRCRRIAIIENNAKLDTFYAAYNPASEKQERMCCLVGTLSRNRGISVSIKGTYLAGGRLALVGNFDSAVYRQEVESCPEYSCVDYKGVLDTQQVVKILSQSRVGICTLLDFGQYWVGDDLATKIGEYMAMGLPVVLHASPFNRKLVETYHCGICVDPANLQEVADGIRYLLDHPKEAQQMGENGRRAVKERFNWEIEEQKLLELYRQILSE